MCRYFPKGCDINAVELTGSGEVRACAAESDGRHTVAVVNWSSEDVQISMQVPYTFLNASVYVYEESGAYRDAEGSLVPSLTGICGDAVSVNVPAQSLTVITDMQ